MTEAQALQQRIWHLLRELRQEYGPRRVSLINEYAYLHRRLMAVYGD